MGFEKFEDSGRGRPPASVPKVSLRKSGSIGINQVALGEYFDENEGAVLYYDEEENRIGIKPVADKATDDAAYTVSKNDSNGTIAGETFLNRYDILPEVTTQYTPQWNDDEDLVVIDLDDPVATYGSPDDESDEETEQ